MPPKPENFPGTQEQWDALPKETRDAYQTAAFNAPGSTDGGTADSGTTAIGRPLYDPQSGELLGILTRSQTATGRLMLLPPSGSGRNPLPFTGGFFSLGSGETAEIDAEGNVRDTFRPDTGTSGGGGGRSLAETLAVMGVDQEYALELLDKRYELEQRAAEAAAARDWEFQRWLLAERDKIDKAAEERAALRDVWHTLTQIHAQEKMAEENRAFQAGESEKSRQFEAQQAAVSREAAAKTAALNRLAELKQTIMGNIQEANQWLATTAGRDPIRAAIAQSGRTVVGRTPMDRVRRRLGAVAQQTLPSVAPGATAADVTQTIRGLESAPRMPNAPRFGMPRMAGGGTVDLTPGRDFRVLPDNAEPDVQGNTGIAVLVGDGVNHEGTNRGTAEVMEVRDDGVRIIPLATRAPGGLEVQRPKLGTRGLAAPTVAARQVARPPSTPAPSRAAATLRAPAPQTEGALALASEPTAAMAGAGPVTPLALPAATPQETQPAILIQGILDRWLEGTQPTASDAELLLQLSTQYDAPTFPLAALAIRQMVEYQGHGDWPGVVGVRNALQTALAEAQLLGTEPPPEEEPPPPPPEPTTIPDWGLRIPPELRDRPDAAQRALDFVNSLLTKWPNVSGIDANLALTYGLPELADLILAMDAGLDPVGQNAAWSAVARLVGGLEAMLPPGPYEFEGEEVNMDAIRQAIDRVWSYLGMDPQQVQQGQFGSPQYAGLQGNLGALGIQQRFIRNSLTGQVFYVKPDGTLQAISAPGETTVPGLDERDILSVSPSQFAQFGDVAGAATSYGSPGLNAARLRTIIQAIEANEPIPLIQVGLIRAWSPHAADVLEDYIYGRLSPAAARGELIKEIGRFNAIGGDAYTEALGPSAVSGLLANQPYGPPVSAYTTSPIVVPLSSEPGMEGTGMVLPHPAMIAGLMQQLRQTDPTLATLLDQAYEIAGFGPTGTIVDFYTPSGTFDPSQTARLG